MPRFRFLAGVLGLAIFGLGCGGSESDSVQATSDTSLVQQADQGPDFDVEALFPDVIAAEANQDADGSWTFSATLSSPYDSAERYADAWRVKGLDGTEFGVRVLTHDHASEQPFTRSKSGIVIPMGVEEVIVEGRDLASGWGGETVRVKLR